MKRNGYLPVDKNHARHSYLKTFLLLIGYRLQTITDRMKKKFMPVQVFVFILTISLISACSGVNKNSIEQYSIVITDELHPAGLLPECMELNSEGQLILRTSRFNEVGTLYQKNFFIELSKKQADSVNLLIASLMDQNLTLLKNNNPDSVVYKVNIDWMINGQRSTHLLIGDNFTPTLNQLIAYCKKLPENNHHYKLKESHYFNTDEICSGMIKP